MINYKQAQEIIKGNAGSFDKELIDIDHALGRVLAQDITASRDYPPFNRSAMDGFALNIDDFNKGIRSFKIIETILAGQKSHKELSSGTCYKIMTGAAVPVSANVVIRREDTNENELSVIVEARQCVYFQNIALKGQDLKKDVIALKAPFKINAPAIGLLASLGKQKIWVYSMPEVAIFTTGNEVISLGNDVNDLQIYNSNLHVLKALLLEHKIEPKHTAHLLDDKEQLENGLKLYLDVDILILSGGVSAGDTDYIPEILRKLGVEILFHKVAIKPGKPILCGKLPGGGLVFALPGNPFSCLVAFKLFIETHLESSFGLLPQKKIKFPVSFIRTKKGSCDEFFPVYISEKNTLNEINFNGSGDIRMACSADALGIQPAVEMNISKGEEIFCIPL
ncbi:MAG: molybdopterin molybdotransferase MoeA [Daejeonella sp.]